MTEVLDRPLLHRLIDEAGVFDPEYGAGLSNHLPMALLALARLGAGESRLREFFRAYVADKKLLPARACVPWPAGDAWAGRLGQRHAWPMYIGLFERWVAREGVADVLAQVLPALMPGVGAAAFHGLIRTAAGVQAGHSGEVAQGLAHWAAFHLPLGELSLPASVRPGVADPAQVLRGLRAGTSGAASIAGRMRDAAAGGTVNRQSARLIVDAATPERLARAAAFAYAESGNFTALHLVTATRAMRVLARLVDGDEALTQAWRWFWQAYAHGVVAARLQPAPAVLVPRPWPELVATALAERDEHVIKLVDAAREQEQHYGGSEWHRAASRAVA
ncbi:MAG: DUF4243 domain-containing protein [Rubrivivax sp.]|nr:DUF4243 domain-containing protein [Rubrivivax sp.]